MSVAVLSPDDIRQIVADAVRTALAAQQPAAPAPSAAEPHRLALTARETAAALGISERTLWSITAPRGPIRSTKAGTRTLYAVADIERWLAQQTDD